MIILTLTTLNLIIASTGTALIPHTAPFIIPLFLLSFGASAIYLSLTYNRNMKKKFIDAKIIEVVEPKEKEKFDFQSHKRHQISRESNENILGELLIEYDCRGQHYNTWHSYTGFGGIASFKVGDTVDVFIDTQNPNIITSVSKSTSNKIRAKKDIDKGMLIVGIILLAVGLFLIIY